MPTDEHSRTEYLRSLLNQQRNINANGGNLLNPAIPNTGGSLGASAMMDTSFQGGGIDSDVLSYDPEKDVKEKNWFENALSKIFGFADEIAAQFGAGFVGAFEGIADLAATGLGALGDATGWYSSDPFTNWAKTDYATKAAEWTKNYGNFTIHGIVNSIRNIGDENYRRNFLGAVFGGPLAAGIQTFRNDTDDGSQYYAYNDQLETPVGQFLGGAAHSIGFMLPSIMTGGIAGAAGAGELGVKAASLASMGLSAAGKGGEEALNDGASAGKALAYGAASGAVEVASEIVVGKFLGLVGLGTGKVMGVIGKGAGAKTASVGSKTFVKELIKTMNEEGAEEIFSAVMEPLTKAIYKGSIDTKNTYGNVDWWFGTNGRFNESVLGQYASGAFVGGLSSGVQNYSVYKKVGKNGYQLVAESKNVAEAIDGLQKAKGNEAKYAKAEQKFGEAMSAFIEAENTFLNSATKEQKIEIAKVFRSANNMKAFTEALQAADVDASVTDFIKNYTSNISTADKAVSYNFLSQMQRKYGTDVELRFDDSIKANGQYDAGTNTITINPKILSTKGGKVLAHEYFGHALSSNMSAGTRAQFYQQIKSLDPSLVNQVESTYGELDKSSPKMREEVISHFLERYFNDSNIGKQLDRVNKAFGDMTLKERIMQAFDKTAKQQKGKAIIKEYGRVLREFLKKSGDKTLLKAAAKSVLNQELSKSEKEAAKAYPSVFDALKSGMSGKQAQGVFASEELASNVDSNGNKLSKEQVEFFKDSKIVDDNGNLKVMYHGTMNPGFTVFDKSQSQNAFFFTDSMVNAASYGGLVNKDNIYKVFLNVTNPYVVDANNSWWDKLDFGKTKKEGIVSLKTFRKLLSEGKIKPSLDTYVSIGVAADNFDGESIAYETLNSMMEKTGKSAQEVIDDYFTGKGASYGNTIDDFFKYIEQEYEEGYFDDEPISLGDNIEYAERVNEVQDYETTRSVVEKVLKMNAEGSNYDGIIFKNIVDFGPDTLRGLHKPQDVVVAFEPNQIKSIENKNPTQNPDIFMSLDLVEEHVTALSEETLAKELENKNIQELSDNILEGLDEKFADEYGIDLTAQLDMDRNEYEPEIHRAKNGRPLTRYDEALLSYKGEYEVSSTVLSGIVWDKSDIQNYDDPESQAYFDYKAMQDKVAPELTDKLNDMANALDAADEALSAEDFARAYSTYRFGQSEVWQTFTSTAEDAYNEKFGNMDEWYDDLNDAMDAFISSFDSYIERVINGDFSQQADTIEETKAETVEEPVQEQVAEQKTVEQPTIEQKGTYKINVSPYRSSDVSSENLSFSRKMLGRRFVHQAERIAKAIGIKFSYRQGVGGFVSEKGRYAGQQVNELTYEFTLGDVTYEQALDFAVLMKYLGHETQEGAIVNRYASPGENFNASEFSLPIKGRYSDEVVKLAIDVGLGNYTYLDSNGVFSIKASSDWGMSPQEAFERFQSLMLKLRQKGLIDENREINLFRPVQSDYIGKTETKSGRMVEAVHGTPAEEWLQTRLQQSGPSLRGLFEQAKQRIEVANRVNPLNERIVNLQRTNKNIDVSAFEHETKVDNGQTKTVLKRTKASEPLFRVAKASNRIANIEMEYVGGVLANVAKSVGIEWDPVAKAQSFKKSVSSTADRLYRNIKNGKGFDVYKLHDRLRTTFIFNMSNVGNMEKLIRALQPYIIPNKGKILDVADTDFGYKGVHLNLKIQDIEVEVQLHSEASWDVKLQQDKFYDRWRSQKPTTEAERAEMEKDRATSIALDKKLGRIHRIITETANKINQEYSNSEAESLPVAPAATTTPPAPAPAPKAPVKQYYKSIETTRDIVTATGDLIVDLISNAGAYDYRIVYPDDFRDTSSVGMTKINSVKDVAKEAHRLMQVMADTYIEERNADGTYTTFGTVADILDPSVLTSLEPYVENIIKSAPDTEARSKATRSLEMQLNRALDKNRDLKSKVVRTRVLTNQRNAIKSMVDRYVEITDEVRAKEGLYTLLQPFAELHGSSSDAFQRRGFKANLKAALEWYTEENMNDPEKWVGIPFDPEVRQALVNVYESLGESEKGSLSTDTMQLSSKAITLIRQLINKMRTDYITRIRPSVDQTYAAIQASGYRKNLNIVAKLYRMYKRGFAPAYIILNQMLGDNSVLARKLTFEMQAKLNEAQLYRGAYGDAINKKLKELGLKKTFDKKRFDVNGKRLSADQAMFLWNALNTQANFDAINDAGITYFDENNNLAKVSEVGHAQELKEELKRVLPENYRKMAEFLLDTMNDSVKKEYMKMYEDRYGKYEHRNEIGKVGDRSYWMLFRSYERITNTEKAVKNPAGMFSHAIKRVNNENAVLIAGALSSFTAYTDQLSREMYVKPTYREALAILNSKGSAGQNVAMLLRQKGDEQDYHYLTNTLSDILVANPFDKGNDIFSRAMSAFSVAKLSLNIGTMLKQFASIWTSNIPMTKSIKGVFSNIFKSPAVKAEYKALVDELGGLKYRESGKGVVVANADSAGAFTQKIANIGMIGISKVDLFTVSSGVVSLMHIAKDQFHYEIGSDKNKQWVKDHWTEFELSQIGGGALSKNAIQRGDFKQLPRLLFGFMQGANRAALGSQLNKIGLWKRNHKLDLKTLRQEKADAKSARDAAKLAYEQKVSDPEAKKSELKDLADAYMDAEAKFLDAEAKLNDYERYMAAGGKAIPVHMASGLIAQGVFIALINELMKHLRGKKDKDDWEFVKDPLLWVLNTAKTIGLDWLPFVNAITSALLGSFERDANGNIKVGKGYELSVPVVEMGNALIDIFNDVKDGKPSIWSIATLAGDMLGIPADLIKDYVRGAIRLFDPSMADKLQNVLYGSSLQSAAKSYQSFLDKGDANSAKSMLKSMFAQYKTGYVSDSVANKIVRLEMNGYDVDVKSLMGAYTNAEGARVQLDAKQINAFKEAYSKSDRAVLELMSTGEFQSSTQEEQAALIKRIYDSYYAYAKAKVTGQADTKMAALLAGTNGTIAVGRFIAMLSKISTIKANKAKSRKELVFDFLKGKGLSKGEQTLILYLAGYGLNDNSKKTLSTYLLAKGMNSKSVSEFLGK